MRRVDMLIATVLVVAAAGSLVGAALYDEDRRAGAFTVVWSVVPHTIEAEETTHSASGESSVPVDVRFRNITRAELVVRVQGGGPRLQSETVDVTAQVPGFGPVTARGTLPPGGPETIEIPVAFDLNPTPTTDTVTATGPEAAARRLDAEEGTSAGTGTWTIRVRFTPAGPGPLDAEEHTVTVTGEILTYRAGVAVRAPDINR